MTSRVRFKRPYEAKCTRSGCENTVMVNDPAFAAGEIRYSLDWVRSDVDQRAAYEWLFRSMTRLLSQLQFGLCADCAQQDVVVQPAVGCNRCLVTDEYNRRFRDAAGWSPTASTYYSMVDAAGIPRPKQHSTVDAAGIPRPKDDESEDGPDGGGEP